MGSKRSRNRKRGKQKKNVQLRYDAASYSKRTAGWITSGSSANTEIAPAIARARDRSRDLARNYAYAIKAIRAIRTGVVKTGIRPKFSSGNPTLDDRLAMLWKDHCESTAIDADGQTNVYGLQALAMQAICESGDILIRRRRRRRDSGFILPFQLQLLEADHLATENDTFTPTSGQGFTYQGITFNRFGERVSYNLYQSHPGETAFPSTLEVVRVQASDIAHGYRVDRPGQIRGMPWGAPIIIPSRDLSDMMDALRVRQRNSAAYTAFITEPDPDNESVDPDYGDQLMPGRIDVLPPGKNIVFADPPDGSGSEQFVVTNTRQQAAGWGITYEAMTGDYSGVNYSSGRLGHIQMIQNFEDWQNYMLVPQVCDRIVDWFLETASIVLGVDVSAVTVTQQKPRRELVDPQKEIPAITDSLRSGLMSPQKAIAAMGMDYSEILEDWAEWKNLTDALGIIFDSDPRKADNAGSADLIETEAQEDA